MDDKGDNGLLSDVKLNLDRLFVCLFVCVGVLRPSQQRGHVEPVS